MKTTKIIQYTAFIIGGLLVGSILLGILNGLIGKGEWNLGWTNYRYDDSAYTTGEGTIRAPYLERIDLDWIDGNVTVVICQDSYISVSETAPAELTEKTQLHWFVSEDGKSLSIKYRGSSSFFGTTKDKNKDLILRIPEKMVEQLQTLSINTISANVTVVDTPIQNTEVQTQSGNVKFELDSNDSFTLVHKTKSGGVPTIDFPVVQTGNTYISGTDGIRITINTNSGKVAVLSVGNN
jgi:hypothetical protein